MGTEIERKFLVVGNEWRALAGSAIQIQQAYLAVTESVEVRVRLIDAGEAWLTIKSAKSGVERSEFEYPIPVADAEQLIGSQPQARITKNRYRIPADRGRCWEIDEFLEDQAGLIIAEIELDKPDADIPTPNWLGKEVTGDARYYNAALARVRRPS